MGWVATGNTVPPYAAQQMCKFLSTLGRLVWSASESSVYKHPIPEIPLIYSNRVEKSPPCCCLYEIGGEVGSFKTYKPPPSGETGRNNSLNLRMTKCRGC